MRRSCPAQAADPASAAARAVAAVPVTAVPASVGPGFGMGLSLESAEGAAKYLGITTAQLHEQIRDGKSLADVAKANNKSVDGLKAAIKDAATKRLDEAVKDGKLTQAQRDEMAATLDERIDDIVNLTPPDRPARPKHRWR